MEDELKKALDELLRIRNEINKLDQQEQTEALTTLLRQERDARKKYYDVLNKYFRFS